MRETASGRRQAPLNVTSSLDAARELGIRDAQALGETLTPAQLGNAALTAQTIQHDAGFLLRGILLAGHPADVLDKPLRRQCSGTGLLSHLHSLAVTMSQKSSVIQYPQSVS